MLCFDVEIVSPTAEKDAGALADRIAWCGRTAISPLPLDKMLDPVVIVTVTAALLQSVDIIYRFYQDFRQRGSVRAGSHPSLTIILPDGTRIDLEETDLESAKLLVQRIER